MSIKRDLFSGVFYTALAKYSGMVVSLIVAGVLARLLDPEQFGVVAVATVIINFFSIFSDLGIGPAVIQTQTLSRRDLSDLFTFSLWMGVGLGLLFFGASWPIATYYNQPVLRPLCQLLAISLLFASLNIVPNALLMKAKRFDFVAYRNVGVQVGGGVLSILAALGGAGLYALIINPILSSILLFIFSFKAYPQAVRWTWGIGALRKIFAFSAYQFLFNFINYFSRNLDKLLIGKMMGMNALGYYEKSYRLMMLPLQNISFVISPVMHPVFTAFQNDLTQLRTAYQKVVHLLGLIGFPLTVFLCFAAQEIVWIVFGAQWEPSVPVFRILALSVGIQIILSTSGGIFQAAGDTRSLFLCGLFSSILNVTGILIGIVVFRSLEAVAWAILITFGVNFLQCYWQMYRVTFRRSALSAFFGTLRSSFKASAWVLLLLLPTLWIPNDVSEILRFIIKGTLFCVTLFGYVQWSKEYDLIARLKNKLGRR